MSKDIEQEMAECEALQQRVWAQRIGGLPLKVYQAIGKASASLCVLLTHADICTEHTVLAVAES